ncbi:hypothetical protein HBI21_037280 [Parastagonospora nodorum]|nr:hypothetical protein HBI21_037280 [Parastagonospora nodorum]
MKPEALEAIAGRTMRPSALEAATTPHSSADTAQLDGAPSKTETVSEHAGLSDPTNTLQSEGTGEPTNTPKQASTPFGQRTDGIHSAAEVVEEVVHGVKTVFDGAIAWAEKKADQLSSGSDSTGPYTSPATCAPSDLDPIASGVLPAMLVQEKVDQERPTQKHTGNDERNRDEKECGDDSEKENRERKR